MPADKTLRNDEYWMRIALTEADKAAVSGEVPVGAVSVLNGKFVAKDHNRNITLNDPSAHAEILVLRKSAKKLKNHRLNGLVVYSTIEPCVMCAGAMVYARIKKSVFGAPDPKGGGFGGVCRLNVHKKLNHMILVKKGVLSNDCVDVIRKFFGKKRKKPF